MNDTITSPKCHMELHLKPTGSKLGTHINEHIEHYFCASVTLDDSMCNENIENCVYAAARRNRRQS